MELEESMKNKYKYIPDEWSDIDRMSAQYSHDPGAIDTRLQLHPPLLHYHTTYGEEINERNRERERDGGKEKVK